MSFHIRNAGRIRKGERQRIRYLNGQNQGAQYAMAIPLDHRGSLQVEGHAPRLMDDGTMEYWVTVINVGEVDTSFDLTGGGFI
jgi:hypothetical protein